MLVLRLIFIASTFDKIASYVGRVPPIACNGLPFTSLLCVDRPDDIITADNFISDAKNRLRDDQRKIDGTEDTRSRIVSSSDDGGDLQCFLKPIRKINDNNIRNSYLSAASSALVMSIALFYKATRADALVLDGQYVDSINKFSLLLPPTWIIITKSTPTPSMLKYQIEESLFIASSIAESCSMSITKSNVQRLLKDFEVEWWFAPVDSISDIGSAELITNLLILQRQAAFESRVTPSEVINASIDVTDGSLVFTFDTPLKGSTRRTLGRAFYRNNSLYVLWISSLSNIVDGQYGGTLKQIQSSFKLI